MGTHYTDMTLTCLQALVGGTFWVLTGMGRDNKAIGASNNPNTSNKSHFLSSSSLFFFVLPKESNPL